MSDIWETIRVEPCIARPGQKVGWVYFIACTETRRCKIGFTAGDPYDRLKALQTGASCELRLIAKHPGTPDTEKAIHDRFSSQRLHGEWFEVNEEIFAYICLSTWLMGCIVAENGSEVEEWLYLGLRMLNESRGPLPDNLARLIGEGATVQ